MDLQIRFETRQTIRTFQVILYKKGELLKYVRTVTFCLRTSLPRSTTLPSFGTHNSQSLPHVDGVGVPNTLPKDFLLYKTRPRTSHSSPRDIFPVDHVTVSTLGGKHWSTRDSNPSPYPTTSRHYFPETHHPSTVLK